tara:strand:+ start:3008 stop:3304 length:297 start_codon:yes stop_codon:yes gene_type:complete
MRSLIIAAVLFAAAPALAQPAAPTALTLVDAASAPSGTTIVDGAAWRCDGAACTATARTSQPATRACRRVVARLGKVATFSYKGVALTAEELAACNAN